MIVTPSPTLVRSIPMLEEESTLLSYIPPKEVYRIKVPKKPKAPKLRTNGFRKANKCNKGHTLTEDNTYTTCGKRRCRTCALERAREHRDRLRKAYPDVSINQASRMSRADNEAKLGYAVC